MAKKFKNKEIQTPDGEIKLKLGWYLAFDTLYPYTYIFGWSFVLSLIKKYSNTLHFRPKWPSSSVEFGSYIFCGNCYCRGLFLRLALCRRARVLYMTKWFVFKSYSVLVYVMLRFKVVEFSLLFRYEAVLGVFVFSRFKYDGRTQSRGNWIQKTRKHQDCLTTKQERKVYHIKP